MSDYYQLLSHLICAAHTFSHNDDAKTAVRGQGASDDFIKKAAQLAHHGEDLIGEFDHAGTVDRISDHAIHVAAQEVEMWLQTTKMIAKKNGVNGELISELVGKGIHGHTHASSVGAMGIRALSMLAAHPEIRDMANDRLMRDTINRGFALFKKLCKAFEVKLVPKSNQDISGMESHQKAMSDWLVDLDGFLRDSDETAALVGYTPEGVGRPIGGNSFAVTLHEKGQGTPPNPADAKVCSQWSIGRQGRNNENLGSGFETPTFE